MAILFIVGNLTLVLCVVWSLWENTYDQGKLQSAQEWEKREIEITKCPQCEKMLWFNREVLGQKIKCPGCESLFDATAAS